MDAATRQLIQFNISQLQKQIENDVARIDYLKAAILRNTTDIAALEASLKE